MNENNTVQFPCLDNANDGCPNMVATLGSHCPDCAEFHASMAETHALLNDTSWKDDNVLPNPPSEIVLGFEIVPMPDGAVDNLPVIIHAEQSDLIIVEDEKVEPVKPDLDNVCYTMNAQEVDAQNALREIVAILNNLQKSLNDVDNAFEIMGYN